MRQFSVDFKPFLICNMFSALGIGAVGGSPLRSNEAIAEPRKARPAQDASLAQVTPLFLTTISFQRIR